MTLIEIFESQKKFFFDQNTKPVHFRIEQLKKLKKLLQDNERMLCDAIQKDFGKSEFDTFANEFLLIYKEIAFYIRHLKKLARPKRTSTSLLNFPSKSYLYVEPLGTTLIIGAWNYPYQLTLAPLVAAIAAGNTAFLKPSELPAETMRAMVKLINSNFPSEYLYVVEGGVQETTELLKLKFDKIFFTGSTRVGQIVYEAAAKQLIPVTLELGGKSPAIIGANCDLALAAKRIVWGKFLNAGQTCIAPDYIYVLENRKNDFIKALIAQLEQFNYEDGSKHYVRIINRHHFDRLIGLLDRSKLAYGGKSNEESLYIQPTILNNITWADAVMKEEIFGPILPILSYTNFGDTVQTILSKEKPLSAYLFSENKSEQKHFLSTLSFGGGCINDTVMHIADDELPFGGVGQSGMGHYHGKFGFLAFSHQKSILKKSTFWEPSFRYPPYNLKLIGWLKRLF